MRTRVSRLLWERESELEGGDGPAQVSGVLGAGDTSQPLYTLAHPCMHTHIYTHQHTRTHAHLCTYLHTHTHLGDRKSVV